MRRRWKRPASDWPDRRHAAAVAQLFADKRREAKAEADRRWEEFIDEAPQVDP